MGNEVTIAKHQGGQQLLHSALAHPGDSDSVSLCVSASSSGPNSRVAPWKKTFLIFDGLVFQPDKNTHSRSTTKEKGMIPCETGVIQKKATTTKKTT